MMDQKQTTKLSQDKVKPLFQASQVIQQAETLLITAPSHPNGDVLSTCLGLAKSLEGFQGIREILVAVPGRLPRKFEFLPGFSEIADSFDALRQTVITIPKDKPARKLLYNKEDGELKIYLAPLKKVITRNDLQISIQDPKLDLVLSVGAQSLDQLTLLEPWSAKLKAVEFLNLDASPENSYFGKVNLIFSASSVAEAGLALIKSLNIPLNQEAATAFLAGLISATENFRAPNTNPQSFLNAAKLLKAGADQQLIIQKLYAEKELTSLKLWARAVKSLQENEEAQAVWATLTPADFKAAGAKLKHLPGALDELRSHHPTAKISFLIWQSKAKETPKAILGFVPSARALKPQLIKKLQAKDLGEKLLFTAPNLKTNEFRQKANLQNSGQKIIELIKSLT